MPYHHQVKKSPIIPITIAIIVVIAVAIVALVMRPKKTTAPTTNSTANSAVTITTDDGIKLAATVKYPTGNAQVPAVILLHEYGQDRHQWDSYLQKFTDTGVAVLSYDMRGFGDSRLASIPKDKQTHLAMLPNDLHAVIAYLEKQPNIDQAKISIIGASVGADVAYVAIGSNLDLYRAVLLSPVVDGTALDGHDVNGFYPTGIYGISSDTEQPALNTFMAAVKDPKQTKIIPGSDHGIALLKTDGLVADIISWIKQ